MSLPMESSSSPSALNQSPRTQDSEHKMRRYLLLLASLAATVTYAAGLAPPGGSWAESQGANKAGSPILAVNHRRRYLAFYYCNATAFAASLVVIFLLIRIKLDRAGLHALRTVMVLDLIALMAAYTAGGCRDKPSTVYTLMLMVALVSYLGIHIFRAFAERRRAAEASSQQEASRTAENEEQPPGQTGGALQEASPSVELQQQRQGAPRQEASRNDGLEQPPVQTGGALQLQEASSSGELELQLQRAPRQEASRTDGYEQPPDQTGALQEIPSSAELELRRKVLMLLAIFVATITYVAGLKPPGGFWEHTDVGHHQAGDVILMQQQGGRYSAFFYCNTTAFMGSLSTIVLLLHKKLTSSGAPEIYGCVIITLQTLVGAYAAGSCRNIPSTTYTFALVACVLACILLMTVAAFFLPSSSSSSSPPRREEGGDAHVLGEIRSLVLLLATLMATITYQAGLNPPGGVWLEDQDGHSAGDPILSTTNDKRYKIFFFCNSAAFVASILVILMVQIKTLLQPALLHGAMILGLFGLIVAYIAGSNRTIGNSVSVLGLGVAFLVYVVLIHAGQFGNTLPGDESRALLKKRRKRLLLLAILMAALAYQAGLSPPGGFWRKGDEMGHITAGSPMLLDVYPRRYDAFFYCNATSFMASIALIILLQNEHVYSRRTKSLYLCMVVGLLGLIAAFAAGSERHLLTSLYVLLPVLVVFAVIGMLFPDVVHLRGEFTPHNYNPGDAQMKERRRKKKYIMLAAILAASVTYTAGLDPPGGVWPDGHAAGKSGNLVLHDTNLLRYHVFFYGNSGSFVASVILIILLLQDRLRSEQSLLTAMNTVAGLDLIGLLVAYAAGSSRKLKTSLYFIVPAIAIYILVRVMGPVLQRRSNTQAPGGSIADVRNGANGHVR